MKPFFDLDYGLENTAKAVKYNNKSIAYGYGNVDALNKFLDSLNKNQIERALGIKEVPKYPLIWLVEGWRGVKVVSGTEYRNVTFHIAVNSNVHDLNVNRKPKFEINYDVAEKFMQEMTDRGVKILPNYEFTKRANFSVSKRGENQNTDSYTIDIWDTLILNVELFINTNCLKKLNRNS